MTDELERRLRVGLHRADLPAAPESLRAALDNLPETAGRMGASRGARPVAVLVVAVASVVIVALLAVWLVPGHVLGPASPSPSAAVSTSPNPTVTASGPPAASPSKTNATVPLGSGHSLELTISDESGELDGVRAATTAELDDPAHPLGEVVAYNPGGAPGLQVVLQWDGVICDTSAMLMIGPAAHAWTLEDGPAPRCDASNAPRAVVLTFAQPIDADRIVVTRESPAALTPSAHVEAAGLLDPHHGWVVVGGKLVVTADGGSSWRDVTPPGGFGGTSGNPWGETFFDAQHGWVAINESFTSPSDPGYGRLMIWRTTDGGASWAKTQLPKAVLNPFGDTLPFVQFDFLDATHGFAFLSGNLAKGKNDSDLFYTADGGQTWSVDRPTGSGSVGIEGNVAFITPTDGVVVNADVGNGIAVTQDGGRTWAEAVLALPSGSAGAQLFFGQPVFAAGGAGVVAVDVQTDTGSTTHVYRTTDAGAAWTDVQALPAGFSWVSVIDQAHWVALSDTAVRHTDDGGTTWTQSESVPPTSHAAGPEFVDDLNGWWVAGDYLDAPLYATSDGGATWQALAP